MALKSKTGTKVAHINVTEFRTLLQFYSMQASFYNAIGHQRRCEASYVKYVQLVEEVYQRESIEASNAYFLVGVFYYEQ
jgi:hypothetical protein